MDNKAEMLFREMAALESQRGQWESLWQELANWVMPRKADITEQQEGPDGSREAELYDGTAATSNETHANGMCAWMHPFDSPWFAYKPPPHLDGIDTVESWFSRVTEVATEVLVASNFHTEIHEVHLDRSGFGTAALQVEPDFDDVVRFESLPVGSYVIGEDSKKRVDTVGRRFELSAWAAKQKFSGLTDKLPAKVLECADDPARRHEKFWFRHVVKPRVSEDQGRPGALGLPWASYYLCEDGRCLVRESGFEFMPVLVTRYLRWSRGHMPYGYCPAWRAMADTRMLNHLQKHLAALVEVSAFPRMLLPGDFEGKVDVSAYGQTFYDPSMGKPEEWLTGGRYDVGVDFLQRQQEAVEKAFAVDVFRMFAETDKEMTATEVLERRNERLVQFSPTIGRFQNELLNPVLERVFIYLVRRSMPLWMRGVDGDLPLPPEELVTAGGFEPDVDYQSRMALALRDHEGAAFLRILQIGSEAEQVIPGILDNFDLDKGFRDLARGTGVKESVIRKEKDLVEIRRMKAEQAAAAAAMEQMSAA